MDGKISESNGYQYTIEYWILTGPDECYDNRYVKVTSDSEEEALILARGISPCRAKDFKIV